MNWTELLNVEISATYNATEGLIAMVDASQLEWKPTGGENWMTTGQLLQHITESCGMCCEGFVTGEWKLPDGTDLKDVPPEQMMPPAEQMRAVDSVEQAKRLLELDKAKALQMVESAGEQRLANERVEAPWAPGVLQPLGQHLLHMVGHLGNHKSQLFYYLKLQGRAVNTGHLYGMSGGGA